MKSILLIIFICSSAILYSQDPHFSNYSNTPLVLNPALTGQIPDYSMRVTAGSRDQWRSFLRNNAFHSSYLSFDSRFCLPIKGDYMAVGLNILGDQRGSIPLQRMDAMVTGAYVKKLTDGRGPKQFYIGAGLEGGFIHHRLGKKDLLFDEQFDDPASNGEFFDNYDFTVPDFGVGLSMSLFDKNIANFGLQMGGAIKHLAEPKYNFVTTEDGSEAHIRRRYNAHLSFTFPLIKNNVGISVRNVFSHQNPYTKLVFNLEIVKMVGRHTILGIGSGFRQVRAVDGVLTDAVFFTGQLKINQLQFSATYDTNVSPLGEASNFIGAFELTLGVLFGKQNCDIVFCPVQGF